MGTDCRVLIELTKIVYEIGGEKIHYFKFADETSNITGRCTERAVNIE